MTKVKRMNNNLQKNQSLSPLLIVNLIKIKPQFLKLNSIKSSKSCISTHQRSNSMDRRLLEADILRMITTEKHAVNYILIKRLYLACNI